MDAVQIVGAGGIGCAIGYALRMANVPATFIEANRQKIASGVRSELQIDDRPPLEADFIPFDDWQPIPGSWIFLCTKCYDNAAVLAKLTVPVRLVPIQNGFDPQLESFGHDYEGIASFVAQADSGRVRARITRPGELHLGCKLPGKAMDAELLALSRAMAKSGLFRTVTVPWIEPFKHSKLMYNAAISPLAAASGIDNGKLLSLPDARRAFFALIQENYRILRASGIELGKIGPFHPATVAWILRRRWLAAIMARFFEPSLRGTYCSMAGEIQKGRTEIDNYNGHLLRLAERSSTPARLNRAIRDLVVRMTAVRAEPFPAVLAELAASRD